MPRVDVPVEISSGEEPVVVRVAEEVVSPPAGQPFLPGSMSVSKPALALRTVVHVAVVGGGRVGLLAQIAGALAAQGLSVSEASVQVRERVVVCVL
jgi:hypothetical protein